MRAARIVVEGTTARAYVPFDYKDNAKDFGGRWNPAGKYWTIHAGFAEQLAAQLRRAGCEAHVSRMDQGFGHSSANTASDWAAALFQAVGPERRDATYRALSKVLHPDAGGDTKLQQQLSAARDASRLGRSS